MSSRRKLLFLLIFISSIFYIFNFLKVSFSTTRSPSMRLPKIPCIPKDSPIVPHKLTNEATIDEEEPLTLKELDLLASIIIRNQKRNLLFFGLNPQFLPLAEAITGGSAIFLEDDVERIRRFRSRAYKNAVVHMVTYNDVAGGAYELLRHGREEADCGRKSGKFFVEGRCRLALSGLPQEIYLKNWDVVVVDGPRSNRPDAPGRMAAIYTAAVIARMGTGTNVVVHDVDRMIEKWYCWEFLCHDNLVSSKGKLWNFRINDTFQSDGFCPINKVQIM